MWMQLEKAADVLRAGGVIAYPTETVYGLGCDPDNAAAVQRILSIKTRSVSKGLILLADSLERLVRYTDIPADKACELAKNWPVATTYLVPASHACPHFIRGDHELVAVRVSPHPLVGELCQRLAKPLVSTSANRRGEAPLTDASQVALHLGAEVDFIVTGQGTPDARPSTIRNLITGEIVRP